MDAQSGVSVGGENKALDTRSRPASSASRRRRRRDRDPKQSGLNYSGGGERNGGKNLSEFSLTEI